jgi:hypothetical protein
MEAACKGCALVVELLIAAGADVDAEDNRGYILIIILINTSQLTPIHAEEMLATAELLFERNDPRDVRQVHCIHTCGYSIDHCR